LFLALAGALAAPRAAGASRQGTPGGGARLDQPIVVAQMPAGTALEARGAVAGGMLRAPWGEGARLLLVRPDGFTQVLSKDFDSACEPDVSFDGKRILLAGKKAAGDNWNIYEMAADGSGVRQITRGLGDCRQPAYQSTLYTITATAPWYQITFVVTESGKVNEFGAGPVSSLYSCRLDGTEPRRLTFNLSSDMDPAILTDGRLVFASWQRSRLDHGMLGRIGLMAIQVDGMDSAAFFLEGGKRIKHMPCETRGGLVVFVEADAAPWDGAGMLSCVALRRPLHSYRPLTGEADGLFVTPAPLPDGSVLVSRRPREGRGTHGVCRFDPASKRTELVFDDPQYHDVQAKVVAARPEPDGRSSVVTEKDPQGKFYCLDVYAGELKRRWGLTPGTIKTVRLIEGLPLMAGGEGGGAASVAPPWANVIPRLAPRRILGEFPVAADGSFNLDVPASTALELQTLDADGVALRTCGWVWAKNHEPRGCIGCHEDGELVPANRLAEAVVVSSMPGCPPPQERRSVDFCRDVMPIVARNCLACHGKGGSPPLLDEGGSGGAGPAAPPSAGRIYATLLAPDETASDASPRGKYVDPGRARTSRLVWHLFGRNTSRPWDGEAAKGAAKPIPPGQGAPLTPEDRQAFVRWIDLGAAWQAPPAAPGQTVLRTEGGGR
jgi:hypothetical protein